MRNLFTFLFIAASMVASAQTNTYSPYSRYGIGDINIQNLTLNKGMGGVGIGLRLPNSLNIMNPAAATTQDTLSFIFDFGLYSNMTEYKSSTINSSDFHVNLDHIVVGFPILKWWRTNIGLLPYSKMGYDIIDYKTFTAADFGIIKYSYKGTGGTNRFFISNAFKIKNLSLGFNFNALFGNLEQSNSYSIDKDFTAQTERNLNQSIRSTSVTFGAQYTANLSKDVSIVLGGVYEPKSHMVSRNSLLQQNILTSSAYDMYGNLRPVENYDTIDYYNDRKFESHLPQMYGAGFSVNFKNKFLVAADFSTQKWGNYTSYNAFDTLADSKNLSFGIQYTPDDKSIRTYWKHISFRAGFYTNDTYLKIRGKQVKDQGVTLGIRFPFRGNKSSFQISYQRGSRGEINDGLLKENYNFINFGISLYDFWFVKSKFN